MKNIQFSAEEDLIERARGVARTRHTTLNSAFREWLQHFAAGESASFDALMQRMSHIDSGGPYPRDEMNARQRSAGIEPLPDEPLPIPNRRLTERPSLNLRIT
jgi:hypothetical protein